MTEGEPEPAPASRSAAAEARRRKILDRGQERLKHITFGGSGSGGSGVGGGGASSSSGGSSVSRSLNFGDEATKSGDFNGGALTPAASGLEPAGVEGAALRSKSWLALQESPARSPGGASRKSSPTKSSAATPVAADRPSQEQPAAPAAAGTPSSIDRAMSAKLQPISSPAAGYVSDDDNLASPVAAGSPQGSSGTHVSAGAWSPAVPSALPLPTLNGSTETSPARGFKWEAYGSPERAAATAARPQAAVSKGRGAAFAHALLRTAAARTLLAVTLAAVFALDGPRHALGAWAQHVGPVHPRAQLLQALPPLPALVLLNILIILVSYLLVTPQRSTAAIRPASWMALVLSSTAPRLHAVAYTLLPLYQQLWQDVAVYIFTLATLRTFGGIAHQSGWPWLRSYLLPGVTSSSWQLAASRWTL